MARFHKGIAYGAAGVLGLGIFGSWVAGNLWGQFASGEEEVAVVQEPGFKVEAEPEPKVKPEPKPQEEKQTLTDKVNERRQDRGTRETTKTQKSLREKWLDKVNGGGMYAFGNDNGYTGADSSDGECQILTPIRAQAQMADNATTDQPGMAIGFTSNDIQGVDSEGESCVAIPELSVIALQVSQAGEYATNRAPVQVESIWVTEDGFKIDVNQPAKHIDGVPGVIGEANHHAASKALAGLGSVLFGLANNVTSAFSFRSTEVTNPVEEALRKRLNQPSEIKLTGSVLEFDIMPVSTPGYNQ